MNSILIIKYRKSFRQPFRFDFDPFHLQIPNFISFCWLLPIQLLFLIRIFSIFNIFLGLPFKFIFIPFSVSFIFFSSLTNHKQLYVIFMYIKSWLETARFGPYIFASHQIQFIHGNWRIHELHETFCGES